eukprot:7204950-Pyramimonas_sp.AAC.1
MAMRFPHRNYLGVEIRETLVEKALARKQALTSPCCTNLHHVAGNVLEPGWTAALLASLAQAGLKVRDHHCATVPLYHSATA